MRGSVPVRLAGMMFVQYFGLCALIVPLTRYLQTAPASGGLGFSPAQTGSIYMTFAFAAVLAPFVVGLLADRWFAAEKVMAACHALMAAIMAYAGHWCDAHDARAADPGAAVGPLFALTLGYAVGTQITLTLTNVISLRNLPPGSGRFWYVRLTGTFGWIVAGVVTGWLVNPVSAEPLYVCAAASGVLALYSLSLPNTPPKGYGRPVAEVIGLPALKLFRDRAFVAFALVLVLCNAVNQFYTLFSGPYLNELGVRVEMGAWGTLAPEVVLTLAQWCEIACMAATPWLLRKFGLKRLLILGLCGLVLRNGLLYAANVPLIVAVALPMHGWGYAFYGMLGTVLVDREAPAHLRAGAQALLVFLGSGPAVIAGNYLAGEVAQAHRDATGAVTWPGVWLVPFAGYVAALLLFLALYRERPREPA
jgi:nucleoside transporter